jgi:multisubunit Na+/H+ antiporter MnhG subunit
VDAHAIGGGCEHWRDSLVAFIVWAKTVREPLVDLGLFRLRTYSAVNAATLSFGIAFAMMFFAFFFYMSNVWHYSQARAGLAIAPGPLMVIPVAGHHGPAGRSLRASAVPRWRRAAVRGSRLVVHARSR